MRKAGNNFSLSFLFMMITLAAVICATGAAALPRGDEVPLNLGMTNFLVGGGFALGIVIGLAAGLHHFDRRKGALIGLCTGIVAGFAFVPLCFASEVAAGRILTIQMAGAIALVIITAALRVSGRRPAFDEDADDEPVLAAVTARPPFRDSQTL